MKLRILALLVVAGAASGALTPGGPAGSSGVDDTPSAVSVSSTSYDVPALASVGPLFDGPVDGDHHCTASVVDSPGHDLVLTAAHCVSGTGAGLVFAPGYRDGSTPYGTWTVRRAYVDPRWTRRSDPMADYAFLVVAPTAGTRARGAIEDTVGANELGSAPDRDTSVRVDGYAAGRDDRVLACTAKTYLTGDFPTFDCKGYVGGTSGSPWLVRDRATGGHDVVAVIGGRNQGGCRDDTSYASPFDAATLATYERAVADAKPDTVPVAGGDGC